MSTCALCSDTGAYSVINGAGGWQTVWCSCEKGIEKAQRATEVPTSDEQTCLFCGEYDSGALITIWRTMCKQEYRCPRCDWLLEHPGQAVVVQCPHCHRMVLPQLYDVYTSLGIRVPRVAKKT